MRSKLLFLLVLLALFCTNIFGEIPQYRVLENDELSNYLISNVKYELEENGKVTTEKLAEYFRLQFSERFFYDWRIFDERFNDYNEKYDRRDYHINRGNDHVEKYEGFTEWKLPFKFKNGNLVDSYSYRHLARQHKMVDNILNFFYGENSNSLQYFVDQIKSLNQALETDKYEKNEDGNGVYEAFRSGYRVLNWLTVHNMLLSAEGYGDDEQLLLISTMLQHGAHLYARNPKFRPGNHQTRGMSALAMLSILFRDFEGTDLWYERSMKILGEHLEKEINNDGFQFERSVHYHMSDIENYFYVYQLANRSGIQVDKVWEDKLRSLFTTLIKIAYPDKSAPVLQDDTDSPWAEKNDISGALTLGYLLFNEPEFGYFAKSNVEAKLYWFVSADQLENLKLIKKEKPQYGSLYFPDTKYYIMREGWGKKDKMMIISAGLDDEKPDHQHGDMLGVQAMANGNVILPNYQVRYSLVDYEFFKNSMVKNVALVDDQMQGKEYKGNKGGSGFGKFKQLPNPQTILWKTNDVFDIFIGSHDGFDGIEYSRQVIYLKDDFWIVKDNFSSEQTHEYKQVWQGHYTQEKSPMLLRSTFMNGAGCDILQLMGKQTVSFDGRQGKEWAIYNTNRVKQFEFITIIYPFADFSKRITGTSEIEGWELNSLPFHAKGQELKSFYKDNVGFLFNVTSISIDNKEIKFSNNCDLYFEYDSNVKIQNISSKDVTCDMFKNPIKPGEIRKIK